MDFNIDEIISEHLEENIEELIEDEVNCYDFLGGYGISDVVADRVKIYISHNIGRIVNEILDDYL